VSIGSVFTPHAKLRVPSVRIGADSLMLSVGFNNNEFARLYKKFKGDKTENPR
jgi:hypothetical protein